LTTSIGSPPPPGAGSSSSPTGVIAAAWLSDEVLLTVAGSENSRESDGLPKATARFVSADGTESVAAIWFPPGAGLLSGEPGGANGGAALGSQSREIEGKLTDLNAFLRDNLAPWPVDDRAEFLTFLASLLAVDGASESLAEGAYLIREALRERLPLMMLDANAPRTLHVDRLHRLDGSAFYVQGWCHSRDAPLASLTAVAPEGCRVELAGRAFRHPRPDVAEFLGLGDGYERTTPLGFIAYFETPSPSLRRDGWVVELRDEAGRGIEAVAPPSQKGAGPNRESVLADLMVERRRNEPLREDHIRPALTKLQELREQSVAIDDIEDYGSVPSKPSVSIIIPLYGRVDFVEHQLAQFVDDPELREAELIYVLDSPELADHLASFASQLHALYRLPFRVVTLSENGGFSLANNLGASVARGRRLLLLNSDVIPAAPGWLGMMSDFYEATPNIGALAPKLLYDDDAIQHAGLYFQRPTGQREWWNEHYFKGLHRTLPAANVARPVPAVTAACLMIDAGVYERLGGLRGLYVQGDYEDSDLCLRLRDAGLECWYMPQVELYHLEGQSFSSPTREASADYNRWLHTRLWNEKIEATMREFGAGGAGGASKEPKQATGEDSQPPGEA